MPRSVPSGTVSFFENPELTPGETSSLTGLITGRKSTVRIGRVSPKAYRAMA
jgi:hypothetical protein